MCNTLRILIRSSGGGGSVVLAPGVAFGPQALLLPLLRLEEEKGVLDTSEGQPAVGVGIQDPIILEAPPDELLGRLGLHQPLDPKPLLLEALWSWYNLNQRD